MHYHLESLKERLDIAQSLREFVVYSATTRVCRRFRLTKAWMDLLLIDGVIDIMVNRKSNLRQYNTLCGVLGCLTALQHPCKPTAVKPNQYAASYRKLLVYVGTALPLLKLPVYVGANFRPTILRCLDERTACISIFSDVCAFSYIRRAQVFI